MLRMQSSRLTLTRDDIKEFQDRVRHGRSRRPKSRELHSGHQHAHPVADTTTDHRLKTKPAFSTRLGFVATAARPALARTVSSSSSRSSEATICAEEDNDAGNAQDRADDSKTVDQSPTGEQDVTAGFTTGNVAATSLLNSGWREHTEEQGRQPAAGSGPAFISSSFTEHSEEATNVLHQVDTIARSALGHVAPYNDRIRSDPHRQHTVAEDIFLAAAAAQLQSSRLPIARRHILTSKAQAASTLYSSSPRSNADVDGSSERGRSQDLVADHSTPSKDESSCVDSPQHSVEITERHRSWSGTQSAIFSTSTSSRSMPNLHDARLQSPQPSSKSNSPPLASEVSIKAASRRVPSMVSAASGISCFSASSQGSDAAQEFLRMRNSPLDELMQELRKLSQASQSQSPLHPAADGSQIGRRVSLLNGDPFGLDDESVESEDEFAFFHSSPMKHKTPIRTENRSPLDKPLPDLPCSSTKSPASTLRTPYNGYCDRSNLSPPVCSPTQNRSPTSMRSFHPITTITQSVRSVKAKMISLTPHVHVYNDSQPAEGQPQTPADLFSTDTQHQMSPVVQGKQPADGRNRFKSSDARSAMYRSTRHTYPASVAGLTTSQLDSPGRGMMIPPSPSVALRTGHRRAADGVRSSTEVENDSDGAHDELEAERRLWLDRQGRGSLDVTPPKEGRFERFTR